MDRCTQPTLCATRTKKQKQIEENKQRMDTWTNEHRKFFPNWDKKITRRANKRTADTNPQAITKDKWFKVDKDISFGHNSKQEPREFLTDKLHMPMSKFVGPKTSSDTLKHNEPVDHSNAIV